MTTMATTRTSGISPSSFNGHDGVWIDCRDRWRKDLRYSCAQPFATCMGPNPKMKAHVECLRGWQCKCGCSQPQKVYERHVYVPPADRIGLMKRGAIQPRRIANEAENQILKEKVDDLKFLNRALSPQGLDYHVHALVDALNDAKTREARDLLLKALDEFDDEALRSGFQRIHKGEPAKALLLLFEKRGTYPSKMSCAYIKSLFC